MKKKINIIVIFLFVLSYFECHSQTNLPFRMYAYPQKDSVYILDSFFYQIAIHNYTNHSIWFLNQDQVGTAPIYFKEKNKNTNWKLIKGTRMKYLDPDTYGDYIIPAETRCASKVNGYLLFKDSFLLTNINNGYDIRFCYSPTLAEDSIQAYSNQKYHLLPKTACEEGFSLYIKPYKGIDLAAYGWLKPKHIPYFFFLSYEEYESKCYKLGKTLDIIEKELQDDILAFRTKFPTSSFIHQTFSFELDYYKTYFFRNDSYKTKLYNLLIKILDDDDNRKNFNKALYYLKLYFPNDPKLKDYFLKQQNNAKTHAKNE